MALSEAAEEKWRPAGYLANKIAAAAVTFAARSERFDYRQIHLHWSGRLLLNREVYFKTRQKEYLVC